jgi:S-adenosylmethionine:tRNA ribosyltransferase-isomerase
MPPFPFEYELPSDLIAQESVEPRDQARLLVVDRAGETLEHRRFFELPALLNPGDLLVLNDTRVLHARLLGRRRGTGGKWEGLFLRALGDGMWEMIGQTRGKLKPGDVIDIEPPALAGAAGWPSGGPAGRPAGRPAGVAAGSHVERLALTLVEPLGEGRWRVRPSTDEPPHVVLERHGHVPLPPYIRKGADRPQDRERYQTVFAARPGAVAAPTAGLHFTPRVFDQLRERGVGWTHVTLHVGLGTFRPIAAEDYTRHPMHAEWGELSAAAVEQVQSCKARGNRVVAVGTTAVRVLETAAQAGTLQPWSGETSIYIYPPYRFRVIDALVTNFHLPRTTLLLLVAAFAGLELTEKAYRAAVAEKYRFYSYGDAMLIL